MKPLTGRGVLAWLVAFFGIIFATNAIFIAMAVKTFSGEDEQKNTTTPWPAGPNRPARAGGRRLSGIG
jgi:hypothetical protein